LRIPIISPPLAEQQRIASFLDEKTAGLQRAVAQKRRMVALLRERKQILIQQAVTQGLNPKAPKKDSQLDWLGSIPKHWEVKRLKYVAGINKKTIPENTSKSFRFEYVDIGSVSYENGIEKTESFSFGKAPSRARRLANEGDTVISTVRTYLKAIDFIDSQKAKYVYSTGFAVLKPKKEVIAEKFLLHFVRSLPFTEQVTVSSTGMSYPAINSTDLGKLFIVLPPLVEQAEIVAHLEAVVAKTDKAIALQEQQIAQFLEYEQVLIDNAVRGVLIMNGEL